MYILIGIIVVVIAYAFYISYKKDKQLEEEGKIIKRKSNFIEKAEDFLIPLELSDNVPIALEKIPYKSLQVSIRFVDKEQYYLFTSSLFKARLFRKDDDGNKAVYTFCFTSWSNHNGSPIGLRYMNMLLTAIEKMFLRIDPETLVRSYYLKTKSK